MFLKYTFAFILFFLGASRLTLIKPEKIQGLSGGDQIVHSLSDIGQNPYGHEIIGQLQYPPPIDSELIQNVHYTGCQQINFYSQHIEHRNMFLMLDRGDCTYEEKAHQAERVRAHFLIIVDNKNETDISKVILSGGGSIHINIPVIMISNEDGLKLKQAMTEGTVLLKFQLEHPNQTQTVEIDFWIELIESHPQQILDNFGKQLSIQVPDLQIFNFRLFFHTWQCISCKMKQWKITRDDDPLHECISGGRYCVTAHQKMYHVSAEDIFRQMIHQYCILQHYGPQTFFTYQHQYFINLFVFRNTFQDAVQNALFSSSNIQQTVLDQCYHDSFQAPGDTTSDNLILSSMKEQQLQNSIHHVPTVLINNITFRGDPLLPNTILQMACQSFLQEPHFCHNIDNNQDWEPPQDHLQTTHSLTSLISLAILSGLLVLLVGTWCYRRYLKKQLKLDISQEILHQTSNYVSFPSQNH